MSNDEKLKLITSKWARQKELNNGSLSFEILPEDVRMTPEDWDYILDFIPKTRAEVIEEVKKLIEPYIRDSVLSQVYEELDKLERGAE